MKILYVLFTALSILLIFNSCGRKTVPGESTSRSVYGSDNNSAGTTAEPAKTIPTKTVKKVATPKVIVVNDNIASKTFDGRLYYDLEGHRYWRNNKDGKYYIYNKSMNNNPDFKKP